MAAITNAPWMGGMRGDKPIHEHHQAAGAEALMSIQKPDTTFDEKVSQLLLIFSSY
jgi:hypothetical protein